jgi:hypothetical protein
MNKIKFIHFKYLRREAHYQFLELFNRLLDSYLEVKEIVGVFYIEFSQLLAKEKKLADAQKNSDYTAQIVAADHRDDRLLIGIKKIISIATRHFNPIIAEAAISLQNRLKPFGDIIRKSYEEEAAAIRILLADFQGEYAEKVDLVGLTSWIMELEIAVTDFERLLQLRNTEQAAKPLERLREIRTEIEDVYRKMIDRFNAFCTIEEKEVYTEFINQLNVQIDYFNEHNHRQSSKDIKVAVVKPIPTQIYKGKAITIIPEVSIGETELVFGKDFTLTYKNNESVGNAEIIVHGKGAYKGNKSITFFISEK